ncbi:MAG: chromosome segregation protein SMC [Candidatus Asgardarchaeia archaeon]
MAYIKKLEITNFKSFGGTTVVNFSNGLNVIVGPNGSGKSNILDAIIFALGMLSAKSLRMRVLSDVIFNPKVGGANLKPANKAIVKLYFDNVDRFFPFDSDNVIISRELHNDGRSIYRINGRIVSRNDLLAFLQSVGLSPDNYNIIPQGKISEIVNMNPMQIRSLIEDIAGISAYDEKKELAKKELNRVEGNLRSVRAVIRENERKLERLKKEKEDAELFNKLNNLLVLHKQALYRKKLTLLIDELHKMKTRLAELDAEISQIEDEIIRLRRQKSEINKALRDIDGNLRENRSTQFDLQKELTKFKTELAEKEATLRSLERETSNLEQELASLRESRLLLKEEEQRILQEVDMLKEKHHNQEMEINNLKKQEASIKKKIQEFREKYGRIISQLDALKKKITDTQSEIQELQERLNSLNIQYETDANLKEDLLERIRALQETIEKQKILKEKLEQEKIKLLSELEDVDKTYSELLNMVSKIDETLTSLREKYDALNEKKNQYLTEKKLIEKVRKEYFSRQKALRYILELRDNSRINGIIGTISEIIQVPEKYQIAISSALGGKLNYIIVENEDVAVECISLLKKHNIGAATFIPLNVIKFKPPLLLDFDIDGIEGRAIDLVKFNQKYSSAIYFLLGNVLVVRDIFVAKKLLNTKWRKVTLEGDIVEPSGLIYGGRTRFKEVSLFTTLSEEEYLSVLKNLSEYEVQIRGILSERREKQEKLDKLLSRKNELNLQIKKIEMQLESANNQIKTIENNISILQSKLSETTKRLERTFGQISKLKQSLSEKEQYLLELNDSYNQLWNESKVDDLGRLNSVLEEIQDAIEEKRNKLKSLDIEITKYTEKHIYIIKKMKETEERQKQIEKNIKLNKDQIPKLTKELQQLREKVSSLEDTFNDLVRVYEKLDSERQKYLEIKENLEKEIQKLKDNQNNLSIQKAQIQSRMSLLEQQRKELTDQIMDDIVIPQEIAEKTISQLSNQIEYLNSQIDALGEINHKAIAQYNEELERYTELKEKEEKILEEKESILKFMEKLERERTSVFMKTLDVVNTNMRSIFSKISPGGEAYLEPENKENPLEGGLLIKAKPAGKNVTHIGMMSGGEKSLVALTLVFALQKYFSAPFYILDEIDAALDNQNADRVARLLKEFSKDAQIIVVTLRDQTMAKADTLIGVTQQKGVTSVIFFPLGKVGLKEAQKLRGDIK